MVRIEIVHDDVDEVKRQARALLTGSDVLPLNSAVATDAEIGRAQEAVADHLRDALLALAAIPDIRNVETEAHSALMAGALYSVVLAGEQASVILSRYNANRQTAIPGSGFGKDAPDAATALTEAAKAVQALYPELFPRETE